MTALYLHIPFCLSKCRYCSFSSKAGSEALHAAYVAALLLELTGLAEKTAGGSGRPGLDTLFIGGGTPTCLSSALLREVLYTSLQLFGAAPGAEISVEANPGTVDGRYLQSLRSAGVNRLSLGVQSFHDRELKLLGRIHDSQEAYSAVKAARVAGFANLNLDLMYGLPGQSPNSWRESLEQGLLLGVEHLSLYQLTIEPDTPFYSLMQSRTITLPSEEEILEMDEITGSLCSSAGLVQYEISNYAVKGRRCRHNINYWLNNDYLAAGAAAVSCVSGVRERRVADPEEYIRRTMHRESAVIERECLSREESFRETVIMGLRLVEGVSCAALRARYGLDLEEYYGPTLQRLLDEGLVQLTATHLHLSPRGWPLANRIMADLV